MQPFGLLSDNRNSQDNLSSVIFGLLGGGFAKAEDIKSLPEIDVSSDAKPSDSAHEFIQRNLQSGERQVSQYDPGAGVITALDFARFFPGAGAVKAIGLYPDGKGGYLPSMREDLERGRTIDALVDALGLAVPAYSGARRSFRFFNIGNQPKK